MRNVGAGVSLLDVYQLLVEGPHCVLELRDKRWPTCWLPRGTTGERGAAYFSGIRALAAKKRTITIIVSASAESL